jgi:hypothetical protein
MKNKSILITTIKIINVYIPIAFIASVAIPATVFPNKNIPAPAPAYKYQGNPLNPSANKAFPAVPA